MKAIKRGCVLLGIFFATIVFGVAAVAFKPVAAAETVAEATNEACIGTTEYATIQEAFNAASSGDTITLMRDVTTFLNNSKDGSHCVIVEGKDVIFDLNGHTFAQPTKESQGLGMALIVIRTDAELTIKDSVGGGKISATATAVQLTGKLILESGTIETGANPSNADIDSEMAYAVWIYAPSSTDAPSFIMKGGALAIGEAAKQFVWANSISVDDSFTPPENYENASVEISGGTIDGTFYVVDTLEIAVSGGTFEYPVDDEYLAEGFVKDENGIIVELAAIKAAALTELAAEKEGLFTVNSYSVENKATVESLYSTAKAAIEGAATTVAVSEAVSAFKTDAAAVECVTLEELKTNVVSQIQAEYDALLKKNKYSDKNKTLLTQYLEASKRAIQNAASVSAVESEVATFSANVALVKPEKDDMIWPWVLGGVLIIALIFVAIFFARKKQKSIKKDRNNYVAPVSQKENDVKMKEVPVVKPVIRKASEIEEAPVIEEKPVIKEANEAERTTPNEETVATVSATSIFSTLSEVKAKSFEEKLQAASEQARAAYETIRAELLSYKKIKSRLSKKADSFRVGRKLIAKITFAGKTIKCYLAVDPSELDVKVYHHRDVSERKAYAAVPTLMRVRSNRAIKNTVKLIEKAANESGLVKKD